METYSIDPTNFIRKLDASKSLFYVNGLYHVHVHLIHALSSHHDHNILINSFTSFIDKIHDMYSQEHLPTKLFFPTLHVSPPQLYKPFTTLFGRLQIRIFTLI